MSKKLPKKTKLFTAITLLVVVIIVLLVWYLSQRSIPIFEPGGVLGQKEKGLIIFALLLSVIVVVPTFALTIIIAVKYNEKNVTKKTKYRPDFDRSRLFESIWWGIPVIIIGVLSYVAWASAHNLSPYQDLASHNKPIVVQVVSMDWKWLFVYPEQNVASVNLAVIPINTPIDFQVTSDTVMNSFWVPGLGGQIYSMPGMITQLHEMATRTGDFAGSPANIAGKGFARMDFVIRSVKNRDFKDWVAHAKQAKRPLTAAAYAKLAKPSMSVPISYYSSVPQNFVRDLAMKYMMPMNNSKHRPAKQSSDSKSIMPSMEMSQ